MRRAALLLLFFAQAALALPDFDGYRADDEPAAIYKKSAEEKNLNVGVMDIEDLSVGAEEMIIRVYAGFGNQPFRRGGYPLDLYELHVKPDSLTLFWSPPCPGTPIRSRGNPERAWQVIQDEDLFTIRDSRAYEDYPRVYDGIAYYIQIKSTDAYREFHVSNPAYYERGDNPRLMAIVDAIAGEFDSPPECLIP